MNALERTLPGASKRSGPLARLTLPRSARAGLTLAFATAVISGVSIFVNSYAVKEFGSASVFSSMKNTIVGAALLLVFLPSGASTVRNLKPRSGVPLLALGIVGGSVPFILFFEGLSRGNAADAAFIQKTLFIWVGILAVPLLRERLGRAQIGAVALLLVAQWMIGAPKSLRPGDGEMLVFAATLLWAVEVIVAKRVLPDVGAQLGATARMAVGAAVLLGYLAFKGDIGEFGSLSAGQWGWLLGTAALLLGYVTTWYAALERAPATAVTCVLTAGAPITAALNVVAGRGTPTGEQLLGFGLVLAMAALLVCFPSAAAAPSHAETLADA